MKCALHGENRVVSPAAGATNWRRPDALFFRVKHGYFGRPKKNVGANAGILAAIAGSFLTHAIRRSFLRPLCRRNVAWEIGAVVVSEENLGSPGGKLPLSIVLARRGSSAALGQLLDHYRDYLLRLANEELSSSLVPKVAHSDLVQETFFQAARDFPKFSGGTEEELRSWLRKILLNNLRDVAKRYCTAQKRSLKLEIPLEVGQEAGHAPLDPESPGPTASARLISGEDRDAVLAAIQRMPTSYQRVIELRSLEGLSFNQVGAVLERSADAARKLWSRAIEQLADEMVTHEPR